MCRHLVPILSGASNYGVKVVLQSKKKPRGDSPMSRGPSSERSGSGERIGEMLQHKGGSRQRHAHE